MTQRIDQGFGAFIAQHHDQRYPVEYRSAIYFDRMSGREDFVPFETEDGKRGDLVCTRVWDVPEVYNGERPMPGWAMAWPVTVVDDGRAVTSGGGGGAPNNGNIGTGGGGGGGGDNPGAGENPGGGGQGGNASPGGAVDPGMRTPEGGDSPTTGSSGESTVLGLPIRKDDYEGDDRFVRAANPFPDWRTPYPKNFLAIGIGGVEELEQHDLLMAGTNELIAPNRHGADGIMGTLVHELEPSGEMSRASPPGINGWGARFQTHARVLRPRTYASLPLGPGNAVCWNLAPTGDNLAGLGAVAGFTSQGDSRPTTDIERVPTTRPGTTFEAEILPGVRRRDFGPLAMALASDVAYGPFLIGYGGQDKHQHGTTQDGEQIHPLHISTDAFFARPGDAEQDAPIEFSELDYRQGSRQPIPVPVDLSYDGNSTHDFYGPQRGLWRMWTTRAEMDTSDPPPPTREPRDPTPPPTTPGGGTPPGMGPPGQGGPPPVITPGTPPTFGGPGQPGQPGSPGNRPGGGGGQVPGGIFPAPWYIPPGLGGRRPGQIPVIPLEPDDSGPGWSGGPGSPSTASVTRPYQHGSGVNEGMMWHPRVTGFGSLAFRPQPITGRQADLRLAGATEDQVVSENQRRPTVGRAEVIGVENGGIWDYAQRPGQSRYSGGITSGAVAYFAGDLDASSDTVNPPAGAVTDTVFFPMLLTPGTYLGFGQHETTPDLVQVCGYRQSYDSANEAILTEGRTPAGWVPSFAVHKDHALAGSAPGGPGVVPHWHTEGWTPGEHSRGAMLADGSWTMIANKTTSDRAAPQPVGDPEWISGLGESPPWVDQSVAGESFYLVAQRYTVQEETDGLVVRARSFIPYDNDANQRMQVWVIENPETPEETLTQIASFEPGTPEGWKVTDWQRLLNVGDVFEVALAIFADAPPTTTWQAEYDYKQSGGTPGAGEIYHQGNLYEMRIHHEDKDGIDRTAQLQALGVGDTIQAGNTAWEIIEVDQRGSHVRFDVQPLYRIEENTYTFTFTETAEVDIQYDRIDDHYAPGHPYADAVQGFEGGSIEQARLAGLNNHAYGVDIEFQEAYVSPDWDIVASSTGSSGGAPFQSQAVEIVHKVPQGTHGGDMPAGTWTARLFNDVTFSEIAGVVVDGGTGQITLPPGAYEIDATGVYFQTDHTLTGLFNITAGDTSPRIQSSPQIAGTGGGASIESHLVGRISVASETVIGIGGYARVGRMQFGQGSAMNIPTSPDEVYAKITIRTLPTGSAVQSAL